MMLPRSVDPGHRNHSSQRRLFAKAVERRNTRLAQPYTPPSRRIVNNPFLWVPWIAQSRFTPLQRTPFLAVAGAEINRHRLLRVRHWQIKLEPRHSGV